MAVYLAQRQTWKRYLGVTWQTTARRWCARGQDDRLVGESRLIYSRLRVAFPSRAKLH